MSKKILIVDDDPAIVDSTKILLEMEGYAVDTILDNVMITKIKKMSPDLILLDIWMSGQDGRDICRELKKDKELKKISVVMISAGKDIEKSATEAGADDFLAKPFEIDVLLDKVKDNLH